MFLTNPFNYRKTVRLSVAKKAYDIDTKPVGLRRTFRLVASPAAMSISGQTAGLRAARRIVAGLRTLAISPVSSRLLRGRKIAAAPAAFAITGRSVNVYKSRVAGFVLTTFAIDGKSVALKKNYVIKAQPASMAVSMKTVGMLKVAGQLIALPLGMSVTAQSILLRAARKLTVTNAAYVMTGQQQRLLRTYPLNASPAALSISGNSALLKVSRKIAVVKADWVFAQPSVTMTYTQNSLQFSLVGSAGSAVGSVTNTTLALGMTTVAGDIICVICRNSGASGTDATMSGYTKAWRAGNSSAATRYYFFFKVSPGGETTVPTLSNSLAHRKMASVYRPNLAVTPIVSVLATGTADNGAAQTTADPAAQVHNVTTGTFPKILMAQYSAEGTAITTRVFSVSGAEASDVELSSSGANWYYGKTRAFNAAQAADVTVDMADYGENILASVLLGITS